MIYLFEDPSLGEAGYRLIVEARSKTAAIALAEAFVSEKARLYHERRAWYERYNKAVVEAAPYATDAVQAAANTLTRKRIAEEMGFPPPDAGGPIELPTVWPVLVGPVFAIDPFLE